MGYCHYYTRFPAKEAKDAYGRFVMDAIAIIREAEKHGIRIASWDGTGAPEITEGRLAINGPVGYATYGMLKAFVGIRLDVRDGSHESFVWAADSTPAPDYWNHEDYESTGAVFGSVKTNEKPYDAVVCALLIAAKRHYGDAVTIGSDGSWESGGWNVDAGWAAGRELYEHTLGEPAECPLR